MNIRMYLAFIKWCFMKMFGGVFDKLESFRYQLKQGAPDSIFAIVGFIIVAIVFLVVVVVLSASFIDDTQVVRHIVTGAFFTVCFTFVYNIVKAAFECFMEEREELFRTLKR